MTHSSTTTPTSPDSAPRPLNEGTKPRAARPAGEAVRPVSPAITIAADLARAALEAVVIGSFIASVPIWAGVILGRV